MDRLRLRGLHPAAFFYAGIILENCPNRLSGNIFPNRIIIIETHKNT